MSAPLRLDSRGRITIGNRIAKNGIEPSTYWHMAFGPNGTVVLTPVVMGWKP